MMAFLDESDDLVSLDTPHHSFPLQHHRDGKTLVRSHQRVKQRLYDQWILHVFNKESFLRFGRKYIWYPVDREFVMEPRIIFISFSNI